MSAKVQSAPARPVVQEHHPCTTCGYDLIGVPATSNCPECGTAVARSIAPPQLSKKVWRACNALEVAALSAAVLLVSLATMLLAAWAGWGFIAPFTFGALAIGALGLVVVEPLVLIPAFNRRRDWLSLLPALTAASAIAGT